MKTLNIYPLLLFFIVLGCKKDRNNTQPQISGGTKFKISFNLNGFTQQITGSANKPANSKIFSLLSDTASVRAMFDSIGYVLFNSAGQYVHSKTYLAKNYTLNTIYDSVLPGNYTVAIYAGQYGVQLDPVQHYLSYGVRSWNDTFEKTFPITVTNSDVNQAVVLNRIVGEIEVIITDNIPPNTSTSNLSLNNDYNFYDLYKAVPVNVRSNYITVPIPDTSIGKPNFKVDYITVNTITPFSFTLGFTNKAGYVIAQRVFDTTSLQPNLKKIYTGKFFETPLTPGSGFSTNVNPAWSPVTTNISF